MTRSDRALVSLDGLSVGDAFGQSFLTTRTNALPLFRKRQLPSAPWLFTDDTEMSLSVVSVLRRYGHIDQNPLADSFAQHYSYDRAYGPSMHWVLTRVGEGEAWDAVTTATSKGQGSYGSGAAMRAAALGAFFADDLSAAVEQAALSAAVNPCAPEGIAAAEAWRSRENGSRPGHAELIGKVTERMSQSEVRSKLTCAQTMERLASLEFPISVLGNGTELFAQDAVPYALWCCGQALDDCEEALWLAAAARRGDSDTICAIVGGVVACRVGPAEVPEHWRACREPLPDWHR